MHELGLTIDQMTEANGVYKFVRVDSEDFRFAILEGGLNHSDLVEKEELERVTGAGAVSIIDDSAFLITRWSTTLNIGCCSEEAIQIAKLLGKTFQEY